MRQIVLSVISIVCVLFSGAANAALNSYLTLSGATQGKIHGGVTQAGREDTMEIYGFSHEVVSPRDAASGLPTGKRQHGPLTITMPLDKSTPLLFNVWATNELITEFRLDMYRPSRAGKEEQYYTIELVNASIVSIVTESAAELSKPHTVTVSFTYQKILETWQNGGITAEADWLTPVP
jgi:type VI secretion system secreted protein Hcp